MAGTPGLSEGVSATLITHETRSEVCRGTLDHLKQEGVIPFVQVHEKPREACEARDVRQQSLQALNAVPWNRGVLFMEDDIRFRSDWRVLLDLAVEADWPTVLCSLEVQTIPRPYCDWVREDKRAEYAVEPRVVPMSRSTFYGAQCLYLPTWFLNLLWSDPVTHDFSNDRKGMAFDSLLNWMMNQKPGQTSMLLAVPDMAQHLSPPSVRNPERRKRQAHMFHWRIARGA